MSLAREIKSGEILEDADLHSSSPEYAKRFSGDIGAWFLEVQERALLSMVSREAESVLDIGGGHGQSALSLANAGKSVTIFGSSPECADFLSQQLATAQISFRSGNLIELPFSDSSFDTVVSLRLMSHCTAWPRLIAEMCRVAETRVIFDYPIWLSSNLLTPLLFKIKLLIEGNTRTYRIFTTSELKREFAKHGFEVTAIYKQFFFPMGIHRALKNTKISKALEALPRTLGLTRLFGSPVLIRFERIAHDN
jgi:2-polyprenyl-3-methyl-5-hydroxy-6-metoxy-1,4-benzoquinol methylase